MLACNPGNGVQEPKKLVNPKEKENQLVNLPNLAYMYGRNIGLAFQLIDDWLDLVCSAEQLG